MRPLLFCFMNGRCPWPGNDVEMIAYHDRRWCRPVHDDKELFALLVLESFSVGLSWKLILSKEALLRKLCDNLDLELCVHYGKEKADALMAEPGMIHHRGKIESIGHNARAFMATAEEHGSFDSYIWSFTEGHTIDHRIADPVDIPSSDALSEAISKDLKRRGFRYLGPVITYSYMQSIGLVNDHLITCPFHQ